MSRRSIQGGGGGAQPPAELEALLGELVAADAGAGGEHPEPARLLAYRDGRLGSADEAALQDHLAACRACSAALLDLDAFESAAAEGAAPAPADLAAAGAWRGLAERLEDARGGTAGAGAGAGAGRSETSGGAGAGVAASGSGEARSAGGVVVSGAARVPRRTARRRPASWLRAAAATVLVALPLTALLIHSRREVGELRRALAAPQAAVPILYLDSTTRDEGTDAAALELPAGDGFFLLAVTPSAGAPAERHRVEVLDERGRVVWRDEDVPLSDHGTLRLGFTRRALPPGRYRIEAAGDDAAPPTVFDFVLRDAP